MSTHCPIATLIRTPLYDLDDEYAEPSLTTTHDDDDDDDDGYDHSPVSIAAQSWEIAVDGPLDDDDRLARTVASVCSRLGWDAAYAPAVRCALDGKQSIGPVVEQLARLSDRHVSPLELDHVTRLRLALGERDELSANVYLFSRFTSRVTYGQSLDLVRFFGVGADVEEIEDTLLEMHRYWYERDSLVAQHPSFLQWLARVLDEASPVALKCLVQSWRHTCSDTAA